MARNKENVHYYINNKMKLKKTKAIGILAAAAFSIRLIIRKFKNKK